MRSVSPIYNLLHQEIIACADHLLETCQNPDFTLEKDSRHILERIHELHSFAKRMKENERYHPLCDLKHYLENTMIPFHDEEKRMQSMRLSEAVTLLHLPSDIPRLSTGKSLLLHCVRHFREEVKPGRPLFRKLRNIRNHT